MPSLFPPRVPRRLLACLVGGLLAGAVTAPAAAADSWTVPADARITIRGHGYGHGHGMSQYGAEGAARAGLGYRKIARFYYPGTSWGRAGGRIAVLVSADTSDDVVVLARTGLTVRDLGSTERWTLPENGASRWRLAAGPGGTTVVSYLTKAWHQWKVLTSDAELFAGGEPIQLVTPTGTRPYRGRLRSARPSPGSSARDTVNVLAMDNYLRGVVPLEMPALWSPAAVQAQAVAARTYAAYERAHPRARHYQICDTTSCQVYGGYAAEHPASNAAIDATRGEALLVGGQPAFTQFSSSSGGWTAAGSVPYLTARADPYDGWSGNPVHSWSVVVTDEAVEARFPAIGNLQRIVVVGRDGNGDWGGRVVSMRVIGSAGRVTVSGDAARSVLGLRSTWFTFAVRAAR
ncbi:MAG TPA: SpoIID/LytB domain-containing protein [Nocardioides sp.]|uniref:SpoIID/LytB domain-containing protein n=1 Tax=Nocardioides sp. TaxID=35761 RepID=UPI002CCEC037|nr:SpoIID/LytB domain-containing protein [Nocardioides sp.]HQR28228.1 SpoIID/LytB domain-containing protein [Nocardioides sp.]